MDEGRQCLDLREVKGPTMEIHPLTLDRGNDFETYLPVSGFMGFPEVCARPSEARMIMRFVIE